MTQDTLSIYEAPVSLQSPTNAFGTMLSYWRTSDTNHRLPLVVYGSARQEESEDLWNQVSLCCRKYSRKSVFAMR